MGLLWPPQSLGSSRQATYPVFIGIVWETGPFVPALVDMQPHNLNTKSSKSALPSSLSPRPPPSDLQMVPLVHPQENNLLGHLGMTKPLTCCGDPFCFQKAVPPMNPSKAPLPPSLQQPFSPLQNPLITAITACKMCDITSLSKIPWVSQKSV